MRSITPANSPSFPSGKIIGQAFAPSLVFISWTAFSKSAPVRSILFTKAIRGTPYLFAWRHTVSLCGCTPATPQNTAIAPSKTRRERSTSAVKSTCPGVSIMLIRFIVFSKLLINPASGLTGQKQVVAAEVIVMPRSRSCSIQSVTVVPSCTSPIL